jgi:hypothetical protein
MAKTKQAVKLIPAFESEEEELAFWDTHDPEEYFEETPVSDVRLAVRPRRPEVSVRLDARLASAVRKAAEEANTDLDTIARRLLRRGLLASQRPSAPGGGPVAKGSPRAVGRTPRSS